MSLVPNSRSHRITAGRRILIALAAVAAPVFLYLIARTAIVGLQPLAAASLPPIDHTRVLRRIVPAFADPRVPVPEQVLQLARNAALSQPLSYEPYFAFGRKAAEEGNLEQAITLMEESRRRRPNFLPTRLLLMAYYSQARRYPEALAEMQYGMASSESMRRVAMPQLVQAARDRDGRVALAEVLARKPDWRVEFFRAAEEGGLAPDQARHLVELVRAKRPGGDLAMEQGLYVQALVRAGQPSQARAVWLESVAGEDKQRHQYLFDGEFGGRPAAAPFGWTVHDTPAGRAEIVRSGGRNFHLEANYFGGTTATLAEQMLALAPGTYQFSFVARSDGGITSGELAWILSCAESGVEIARMRIASPTASYRKYQGEARVPASGCAGQRLRLVADPGDVAAVFAVDIDNMQVVRR